MPFFATECAVAAHSRTTLYKFMMHEATLVYTEVLLKEAVFGFWRRTVGVGIFIAAALVCAYLVYALGVGSPSWVEGALGAVVVLAMLMPMALYLVHYRKSFRKFRAMREPRALMRAEDSSLTVSSDAGSSTIPWSRVSEVWRFPGFWLLLFSKAEFMTVPTVGVSAEMQTFILQKVQASGGKLG